MKYYRMPAARGARSLPARTMPTQAASEHATHFLAERVAQVRKLEGVLNCPPIIIAPYDAELFGHWWYEGPEFLDFLARKAFNDHKAFSLTHSREYVHLHPTNQVAAWRALKIGRGRLLAHLAE